MRELAAIRWSAFQTAYGPALLVPWRLFVFRFGPARLAAGAGHKLWCSLCHQHAFVSTAALPAAPFLIDVLERTQPAVVEEALDILLGFLRCTGPSIAGLEAWHAELRTLTLGAVPTVRRLAASGDADVAHTASLFLSEAGVAAA